MATYYVKNGGNNALDGLSDGNAWETIAKVNGFTFAEGDTISFKCGSIWREQLTVPRSGAVGNYMKFNFYSTGDKPRILGSEQAITWTGAGYTNIWQSATSLADPNVGDDQDTCFEESDGSIYWGTFKIYTSNFSNLISEYDWTWNANTVYVYAESDPDSRYTSVEVQQRETVIYLNDKDYIEIDGLEIAYTINGVKDHYSMPERTGFTIKNCHIHHMGTMNLGFDNPGYGIQVSYNTMLVEYNIIHDCGRRGCCIYSYVDYDIQDIIVRYNEFYNGTHTTGVDMSTGSAGGLGDIDNVWIYNNYFHDQSSGVKPWASVGIYLDGSGSGVGHGRLSHIWIFNNIISWTSANALRLSEIYDVYVYNNTFYEHNPEYGAALLAIDDGGPIEIKNNIFYTTFPNEFNIHGHAIQTSLVDAGSIDIDANYNLVYRTSSPDHVIYSIYGVSYSMNEWADIKTDLSWELNSPNPDNPDFVSTTDYHLQLGSPAIDAGVYLNGVVDYDYEGNLRNNPPSIGAYEFGSNDVVIGAPKIHNWSTI